MGKWWVIFWMGSLAIVGCTLTASSPAREARAALELWFQAYENRECQAVMDGLSQIVVENQYQAIFQSCQQDPLPWTQVSIGPVVDVQPNRVIFQGVYHLPSGETRDGFFVMHREEGQWHFAWDILRPVVMPALGPKERKGFRILLAPGWERVDRFTLNIIVEQISPFDDEAKEGVLCAWLFLEDGNSLSVEPCPKVSFRETNIWQGELVFPKPKIGDMPLPQRLKGVLQFAGDETSFQFTLRKVGDR